VTFDVTAALTWVDAGCSVIPIRTDGSKGPAIPWKDNQTVAARADEVSAWAQRYDGFGVVCGAVSGGLEMFEFEGRAVAEQAVQTLRDLMNDHGFGDVWERLINGYMQASPSGGLHIVYRVDGEANENMKLAQRPSTDDELAAWKHTQQAEVDAEPDDKVRERRQAALDRIIRGDQVPQTLIETRGEGGQFVAAPSGGRTHPRGGSWCTVAGSVATIAVVTEDERDMLYAITAMVDQMPPPPEPKPAAPRRTPTGDADEDKPPGADFNDQATWDDILNTALSKFAVYAHLEHGGNFSAAAGQLRREGYGGTRTRSSPLAGLIPPSPSGTPPLTDGNLALVHDINDKRATEPRPARPGTAGHSTGSGNEEDDDKGMPLPTGTDERHRGQLRMAERFIIRHQHGLRKAHGLGWHCWDGARWRPDEDEAPIRAAIETIKVAYEDLPDMDKDARKALLQDIVKVESANGCAGMLTLAGALPPVTTSPSRLDSDPYLFNLPTGTIDLRTGAVREHHRDDLITRVSGSDIGQQASPEWDSFLQRILPDEDVRAFVQRLFGQALLGRVTEHVMPIFTGTGANGKGTLRDAILAAFGDYALEVDPRLLMESKHERHSTELMELRGRRLVFCSETEKGRRFAEATMKRLVGGDPIQARRMHKDPITFLPSHTLVMLTNHLPTVSGDDPAVWRRLLVVPFEVVIPEAERDGTLPDKLRAAAPAVLHWVHEGWLTYQEIGLAPPGAVRARTEAYRADSDALGRFVDERCMVNPHMHVRARDLYSTYLSWCSGSGERHVSETELAKSLAARGFQKSRSRMGFTYQGLGLLSDENDESGDR
jgi:putative DNA primase/helicase